LVIYFITSRPQTVSLLPTTSLLSPYCSFMETDSQMHTHRLSLAGLITNQPQSEDNHTPFPEPHPCSTHSAAEPKHTPLPHTPTDLGQGNIRPNLLILSPMRAGEEVNHNHLLYLPSLSDSFWLIYSTERSTPSTCWDKTAPSPLFYASVCRVKGREKLGV